MNLTDHEKHDPVWIKLRNHLTKRLESLRAQNDSDLDEIKTARLRGRIDEIKALLDLEKERPKVS